MSVLQTTQEIQRIYLPSTAHLDKTNPDADWVDIAVGELLAGDMVGVDPKDEIASAFSILVNRIKDWSFTDIALVKLPVTLENVKGMKSTDVFFLAEKVMTDVSAVSTDTPTLTSDQKKS